MLAEFLLRVKSKTGAHLANQVEELNHHKRQLEELLVRAFTISHRILEYSLYLPIDFLIWFAPQLIVYAKQIIHVTLQT